MEVLVADGEAIATAPAAAARMRGSMRALLTGERTALNLLQRMSGIATATRRYVEAVGGHRRRAAGHAQDGARPARARQVGRRLRRRHATTAPACTTRC